MKDILITGASGNIGKRIAELMAGKSVRMMGREPAKLPDIEGFEKVKGDYSDKDSLIAAFAGIQTAFIVSGYAAPGKRALLHKNAIDAAAQAGVSHLVYLSFQGAAPDSKFPMSVDHFQTEQFIKQSGLSYTLLRDSFYMDLIPEMFGNEKHMKGPGGEGKVAWVAREDVSACVAAVLSDPGSFTGTYDLTGAEALSLRDVAERFSSLTGDQYIYEEETADEGTEWRSKMGVPEWEVETWVGSYLAISAGEVSAVSQSVENMIKRKPVKLDDYIRSVFNL